MKYASVVKRKQSPFWSIIYSDAVAGRRLMKVTNHRVDSPMGRRKALDEANELGKVAAAHAGVITSERWENWVDACLRVRYRSSPKTLTRALGAWSQWAEFLGDRKILVPRGLDYNAVMGFVAWRTGQRKRNGDPVSNNTAICDVRICSVVMQEAMRRGFVGSNPCARPGLSVDLAEEKPEITPVEEAKIRAQLPGFVAQDLKTYGYMPVCFEIAIHQGCRLRETEIPFNRIDFQRGTVTLHTKGGKRFATLLHPKLRPILEAVRASGRVVTCVVPMLASKHWRDFFDSVGMNHLSFHCTRVTVVTRLARAGVPISQAMSFVGHSSRLVHRIYTRLQPGDLSACVAALT